MTETTNLRLSGLLAATAHELVDSLDGGVRVGDRPAGLLGRDEADRLRGLRFGGLSRRGL
jgi:hypothetical protein